MVNERFLGEPSAAEACLGPNSSEESEEEPSETSSQAKRRRIEANAKQVDEAQLSIAERSLQNYVDELTDDFDGRAKLKC